MSFTPEQQEEIQKLQQLQQNFEQIRAHRIQLERRENELKNTLSKVNEMSDDTEIFKNIGQLMIKSKLGETKKEMLSEMEDLESKIISIKSREKSLEDRFNQGQADLRAKLGQ